jgi:hypothetical protein
LEAGGVVGFARDRDGDLLVLLGLGLGALLFETENGLVGGQVLAAQLHALALFELVGADVRVGGDVGDLLDTQGIEHVLGIQDLDGRLLEKVDGRVVQDVTVQILADDLDDLILEDIALIVELFELHLLAHGLERLGELGREQLFQRLLLRGTHATDGLGDPQDVVGGLVHPHEEGDLDVGANVVRANQAFLAPPLDLDGLDRQVHDLGLVDHRQYDGAGEAHLRLVAHLIDDHGLPLRHLFPTTNHEDQDAEENDRADDDQGKNELRGHL